VVARIAEGLQSLQATWPHETVALVVHGFVIRSLRFLLDAIPEDEFFVHPKIGDGQFFCATPS